MGDRQTLAKAKKELEELYLGVPDDSVNLTFQDMAQLRQQHLDPPKVISSASPIIDAMSERSDKQPAKAVAKLPSLDFSKGLESSFQNTTMDTRNYSHHHHRSDPWTPQSNVYGQDHHGDNDHHRTGRVGNHGANFRHDDPISMSYNDMSHVSGMSMAYGSERKRRPGIPHSNICTVCCNYIYICRHRCLVCGRVYCRQCVNIGMGDMNEGRKCIECLGRRFSQRYIKKAGNVGCCMGYPSAVKQRELKWAEKGPRRSGENKYNHSVMVSTTRSPIIPAASPSQLHSASNPPSFVLNSPYSPRNIHHPMPF